MGRGFYPGAAAAIQPTVQAFLDQPTIPTVLNFSDLPDPTTKNPGDLHGVQLANEIDESTIVMIVNKGSGNQWQFLRGPATPKISFTATIGAGVGELPEDVSAGTGGAALGTGWTVDPTTDNIRPAGIAITPLVMDAIELGTIATGLYTIRVQVAVELPEAEVKSSFAVQRDGGGGFVDLPGGDLFSIEVLDDEVLGVVTLFAVELNVFLLGGDLLRTVVRTDGGTETYTIEDYRFDAELDLSPPT